MTPAEKQQLLDDTLAWVNEVRGGHGLEPLNALRMGGRKEPCECPVASSLLDGRIRRASVAAVSYELYGQSGAAIANGVTPSCVSNFIFDFDNGEIPELDIAVGA